MDDPLEEGLPPEQSSRDALRLHRADRRAERRQVDADQRAGRLQGHDRVAARCRRRARWCAASRSSARRSWCCMDTPGIFAPRRRLDRAMVTTAWGGAHDADIVCLLVDAKKGLDEEVEAILAQARRRAAPQGAGAEQGRSRRKARAVEAGRNDQRARRASTRPS